MLLSNIIENIQVKEIYGRTDIEIVGLCADSQRIKKGELFFCYKGGKFDSHSIINEIVNSGAAAVVCEHKLNCSITQIIVENGRAQIARAAQVFYGFPSEKLKLIGVTGTNGKTTVTHMLSEIYKENGSKTGVIGTLGVKFGEKFISPELTTPDPIYLNFILAEMVKDGVEYVFMEVSAHAIYFDKIYGLEFKAGIFTNCTQDHLDFFGNMKDYSDCKKSFFLNGRCKRAIINSDDVTGIEILAKASDAVSYGLKNPADVFAVDLDESIDGTKFVLNLMDELYEIKLRLPAIYNVYNALAAAACAKQMGIKINVIARGLQNLQTVEGRLERVANYNGAEIFVDFAHTPDGLEQSLRSLKRLCKGKLYCLFGCGGNRDRTKRPVMGAVAAKYADFCVITSDNPRYEDPYDIISEIEKGIKPFKKPYVTVTERDVATEYAIRLLNKGDILIVAGKGGEHYQEIAGIKHSYNDNTVIKNIIGN